MWSVVQKRNQYERSLKAEARCFPVIIILEVNTWIFSDTKKTKVHNSSVLIWSLQMPTSFNVQCASNSFTRTQCQDTWKTNTVEHLQSNVTIAQRFAKINQVWRNIWGQVIRYTSLSAKIMSVVEYILYDALLTYNPFKVREVVWNRTGFKIRKSLTLYFSF